MSHIKAEIKLNLERYLDLRWDFFVKSLELIKFFCLTIAVSQNKPSLFCRRKKLFLSKKYFFGGYPWKFDWIKQIFVNWNKFFGWIYQLFRFG